MPQCIGSRALARGREPSGIPVRHAVAMKVAAIAVCCLVALAALACGDDEREPATPSPGATSTVGAAPSATAQPSATWTPPAPTVVPTATPTAPPAATSGIEGYVTIGPQCPVVQQGSPCPDAPFEASLALIDAVTGAVAASGRSDASGYFRIDAPPGTYRLVPQAFDPLPRSSEQDVTVPASGFVQVAVQYDSGIR